MDYVFNMKDGVYFCDKNTTLWIDFCRCLIKSDGHGTCVTGVVTSSGGGYHIIIFYYMQFLAFYLEILSKSYMLYIS